MKISKFTIFGFLLSFSCIQAQSLRNSPVHAFRDYRAARISFENVDFTLLQEEARRRRPALALSELEKLVRSNFQFIFYNKLNQQNFLVPPEPQVILEKVVSIFRLDEQLQTLVQKGRKLGPQKGLDGEKRELVQQIGILAKELRQTFCRYFLEVRQSSYTFDVQVFKTNYSQFLHYIVLSGRISRLLNEEMEHYFLNPTPGVVEISEYGDVSIAVLSESICRVSSITTKRLRR